MEILDDSRIDRGEERRRTFLTFPVEESTVEYKEGIALKQNDSFTLKLIKHIIGMCNAGGGFIVIGYGENEFKQLQPSIMNEAICVTYDSSTLAQMVEKYTIGTDKMDFKVHKDAHPETGIVYPIIEIEGFKKRPFFCKSTAKDSVTGKEILVEGALYLRIPSARTTKIADPVEWDQLIDRCVEARNEELLQRFSALAREIGLVNLSSADVDKVNAANDYWLTSNVEQLKSLLQRNGMAYEGLQFHHWIDSSKYEWNSSELKEAAERAVRRNTGWPMGLTHDAKPVDDGIQCVMNFLPNHFDFWNLSTDGKLFYFRCFDEDYPDSKRYQQLWFDVRIWRIAEVIDHTIALYKELKIEPTDKIKLSVSHLGLKGRILTGSRGQPFVNRHCEVDEHNWAKEASLDFLITNRTKIVFEICDKLYQLFNFFKISEISFQTVMAEYDKSSV